MIRCFLFLLIVAALPAWCQDSVRTRSLDEVVVTGQYEPQSIRKSVYQLRTIPMERILAKGASSLQDVLNTELNLRFSQDLALGLSSITMNGLPSQYVKVLLDGVPIVGKVSGNAIDLNQINVNTIERVEIVEGPMAIAYGADAMAGVINIITKKADQNKMSLSARLQEETVNNEYGISDGIHNEQIASSWSWKKAYAKAEVGHNYFGGWRGAATGRQKQWYPKDQWLGAGVVGFKTERLNIYYRLDALREVLKNLGAFQGGQALDQRYISHRLMHQLQGDVKISDNVSYNAAFSFTDYARKTQSVNVDEKTGRETLSLGAGQQDVTAFTGYTLRGTFRVRLSEKLSLQPGYDVNAESGSGDRLQSGTHTLRDNALFASFEYNPVKAISLRPGVRFEKNSQFDAPPVIPAINTKFDLLPSLDLRLSYARGFRAPSLRELYFNFFDASHSIEGNPNLKAELSNGFNGALTWQTLKTDDIQWQNSASAFYNDIDNMINTGYLPGNTTVTTYINVDHYKSKGIVFNSKLKYRNLDIAAGFSYTGRYNEFREQEGDLPSFMWSPEVNSNVSYRFSKIGLAANAYFKHTGNLPYYEVATVDGAQKIRVATISSFEWADVSVQKKLFRYVDATAGVHNLFNVMNVQNSTLNGGSAHSDGPVRPVGYGRSYFLSLTFQLTK